MRTLIIAGFAVLAAAAVVLTAAGRLRRLGLTPLGELLEAVAATRAGRVALTLGWAWLGWHLLAR